MGWPRPRRWWLVGALGALVVAAALGAAHAPLLRGLGRWLVVEDALARADAIVVVAGSTPTNEEEAAALYRAGWAPRVILSRQATPARHVRLMQLGVRPLDLQGEARAALEKSGVPGYAIVTIHDAALITESELRLVYGLARQAGYRRLILVGSADHTRRLRMIWARESGGRIAGLLHPVRHETFSPEEWWRKRRMAELVLHEYLGIAALALGISDLMK